MLHNKYFEIINQYLGNHKRELYGRELIGKVSLSQKAIALALEELEQEIILKSRKQGNIKYYYLNQKNTQITDFIIITELKQKIQFFQKHRTLAHIFKSDDRMVGIFGSYSKGEEDKHSDIDLFIIGKEKKKDYDSIGKEYDLDISIKYFSEKEFIKLLEQKNNLIKEIIENHIIIFGVESFVEKIRRYFYGIA